MLKSGREIGEELFDFYVYWMKRSASNVNTRKHFFICTTSFYTLAMRHLVTNTVPMTWSALHSDKRKLTCWGQRDASFWKRKIFIMPVCVDHHFLLAVVQNPSTAFNEEKPGGSFKTSIWIMDSLQTTLTDTHEKAAFVIRNFFTDMKGVWTQLAPSEKEMPVKILKVPQQSDSSNDCGPYALNFIELLLSTPRANEFTQPQLQLLLARGDPASTMRTKILAAFRASKDLYVAGDGVVVSSLDPRLQQAGLPSGIGDDIFLKMPPKKQWTGFEWMSLILEVSGINQLSDKRVCLLSTALTTAVIACLNDARASTPVILHSVEKLFLSGCR